MVNVAIILLPWHGVCSHYHQRFCDVWYIRQSDGCPDQPCLQNILERSDGSDLACPTLFNLVVGSSIKTIPLRNIASVGTNTKLNLGSLVWGLIFLFVGFGMFNSNALVAIICLLVAVANFANVMSATLTFHDPSGGANAITVSIFEKDKLMSLA